VRHARPCRHSGRACCARSARCAAELERVGAVMMSPEQRRALKLLAGSPDGCTMSIMLADLVCGGLASTEPETVRSGRRSIEVVRMRITAAGRRALADHA
jgi:hypothetical protein